MAGLSGRIHDRFEVERQLGSGGMGEVYVARDTQLKRRVALKRLPANVSVSPRHRRRLLREARSAARISHQGIAALYDVVEEDGELLLVMEFVDGETLHERLRRPLTDEELLAITRQTVEALAAAHASGVIHRDIKPANIMVTPSGQVKILDFGVARAVWDLDDNETTATFTGPTVAGTPGYMAPEVLLGQTIDHRADLFSLGVMLYELVTGHHPFTADTASATADNVLHSQPLPVARVRPGGLVQMQPLLDKLLAKRPRDRYATTDDLLVDVRHLQSEHSGTETTRILAAPAAVRRKRAAWAAAVVVVLAVAAAVGIPMIRQGRYPGERVGSAPGAAIPALAANPIVAVVHLASDEAVGPDLRGVPAGLAATVSGRLTKLTRSNEFQVVPSSSVRRRSIESPADAGRELGVSLALTFLVQRFADDLRVNLGLVKVAEEREVDAATIDGTIDDLLGLQERVATRAVRMLQLELRPMDRFPEGTKDNQAYTYYLQGRGYLEESRNPEAVRTAISLLEQAASADPGFARAQALLGIAYWYLYTHTREAEWITPALDECNRAAGLDDLESLAHSCLGEVYRGTGRLDEAIASFRTARDLDPTNDTAVRGLGRAYQDRGDGELAEETFREAIAIRPHYWANYRRLGSFYLRAGRYGEAIDSYEQVVRLAPDNYQGFSDLGVAYYSAGQWAEARRAFQRAIEIKPDYYAAYSNLGTVLFFEGRYAEAAEKYEIATEAYGQSYTAWGNLGDAYSWVSGEGEKAGAAYRRAVALARERLEVNPDEALVNARLAYYLAVLGEEDEARAHIGRALDLGSASHDVQHKAAQVYARLGESNRASKYLEAAIQAGYPAREVRVDPVLGDLIRAEPLRSMLADG